MIANLKKYNLEHTNNILNSAGRRVWGYLGIEALVRPEPPPPHLGIGNSVYGGTWPFRYVRMYKVGTDPFGERLQRV